MNVSVSFIFSDREEIVNLGRFLAGRRHWKDSCKVRGQGGSGLDLTVRAGRFGAGKLTPCLLQDLAKYGASFHLVL